MKPCFDPIVVEYSPRQKAFHISTLGKSLQCNLRAFIRGTPVDFTPLGIFATDEEAARVLARLKVPLPDGDDDEGRAAE